MKSKGILIVLLSLATILTGRSFGDDKEKYGFYVPSDKEELYGTWINTTYSGFHDMYPQKIVMYDWGDYEEYARVTDQFISVTGTYVIVDKWTDSEGNIWYKEFIRERHGIYPLFEIDKISKDGTVWEYVFDSDGFPNTNNMNAKNPFYRIRYRE